jgi:hypothetical protein
LEPSGIAAQFDHCNWQCLAVERHRSHLTDCFLPPCPTPSTAKIQFGPVRSARSVFASSTEIFRNSLILIDFYRHRRTHSRHRFGRRFGIEKQATATEQNSLKFFTLRAIKTGVTCTVNP